MAASAEDMPSSSWVNTTAKEHFKRNWTQQEEESCYDVVLPWKFKGTEITVYNTSPDDLQQINC